MTAYLYDYCSVNFKFVCTLKIHGSDQLTKALLHFKRKSISVLYPNTEPEYQFHNVFTAELKRCSLASVDVSR